MELLIMICLLLILVLLLQDKIVLQKWSDRKPVSEKVNPDLPEIMGQPKPISSLLMPNAANERQVDEVQIDPSSLDIEYDENEIVDFQVPEEDLKQVSDTLPDFEKEEEELDMQGMPVDDFGFAQGVTFEELTKVGKLLQHGALEQPQKSEAIEIVQKIQGTELFYLLESSIEGASQKIAHLLDTSLGHSDSTSSKIQGDVVSGFDIGEFI
ncbi:MAG: conjugal transfer protein TraD [Taibaiella sp.]|nr:conjugal transfer protein TraD [Taibaiella sp.]